jgi:hypothetical protein
LPALFLGVNKSDAAEMARKSRVKAVSLSKAKDNLSYLLREAVKGDIVITWHGKPRFLRRIEKARRSLKAGRGIRLEDTSFPSHAGRS